MVDCTGVSLGLEELVSDVKTIDAGLPDVGRGVCESDSREVVRVEGNDAPVNLAE